MAVSATSGRAAPDNVGDKARGERDDAGEQVAVREPQRQRVARAIGEPADGYSGWIDVLTPEHLLQGPVQEFDIGAEPAQHDIPGVGSAVGREQEQAVRIGQVLQLADGPPAGAGSAVQDKEQRCGTVGTKAGRPVQDPVPFRATQSQTNDTAGRWITRSDPGRARGEPPACMHQPQRRGIGHGLIVDPAHAGRA